MQNLRDELYQSKLRLEKETSSLKEANKVRFEFSKFVSVAMYEENELNTRIVATIQELFFGCTINKQNHRKVFQASIGNKSSWHFAFHDISYFSFAKTVYFTLVGHDWNLQQQVNIVRMIISQFVKGISLIWMKCHFIIIPVTCAVSWFPVFCGSNVLLY